MQVELLVFVSHPELPLIRSTFMNRLPSSSRERSAVTDLLKQTKHNVEDRCERQQSTQESVKLQSDLMQQAKLMSETNYI